MKRNAVKNIFVFFILLFNVAFVNAQKVIKVTTKLVLIDTDTGIGKISDIIKISRLVNNEMIDIGTVKIVMFKDGKTAAEIIDKKEGFTINVGDFVKGQELNSGTISDVKHDLTTRQKSQGKESILLNNDILIVRTEGSSFLGSGITEDDAKTLAINDAKRSALEYAGTYLESHTEVLNFQLVKDEIITYTGGLLKVTVLTERRMLINDMFAYGVEIEATIDTRLLNQRIVELRQDSNLRKQLEAERERNKRLEVRIAELQSSFGNVNKKEVEEIVNALSASDWLMKVLDTKDPQLQFIYCIKAIELDPKLADAYICRGYVYDELGKYDEALQDYTRAIELDPKETLAFINRGATYVKLGKYDEALRDYNRAIELDPKDARSYNNRGIRYNALGIYNEAIRDHTKAIELDSRFADAYICRGYAYDELGKYDEAIRDYNKAIELKPDEADFYFNRGIVYDKLGKYDEAIRDYNKAIELKPDEADFYYNRGIDYVELSKYDEAMRDFNKATEIDTKYVNAYTYRGLIYFDLGRYDETIWNLNKAIELDPKEAKAYLNRGLAYNKLGKNKKAADDLNDYLRIDGNKSGNAEKIRQMIRELGYTPKY